jgi:cytochrome c553
VTSRTTRLKTWALRGAALVALLVCAGFLVAASGLVPIAASSGHWRITEWFLQLGKRRSVATHSLGVDLPALDTPWLVAKGARHYETACRPCHGSPEHQRPRIAGAMLPPPPYLPPLIRDRDPEHLFYVIKHGIKFTGMPAWPAQQRDDEVHAMVAFLLAFASLDAPGYRRLAHGDPAPPAPPSPPAPPPAPPSAPSDTLRDLSADVPGPLRAIIASCDRCHGAGRDTPAFPRLAGQKRDYLFRALDAYARDARPSGIMGPIAAALSRDDQRALADHYSRIPAAQGETSSRAPGPPIDTLTEPAAGSAIARGQAIANHGVASRGIPACQDCHGPARSPRNAAYPLLAGQPAAYLVLQLQLFHRGARGGSAYAHLMLEVAPRLTAEQMRDVAAYYSALPGAS